MTAEEFVREYAKKDWRIKAFISDGGGELANNLEMFASIAKAYAEHKTAEQSEIIKKLREQVKDFHCETHDFGRGNRCLQQCASCQWMEGKS